KYNMPDIGAAIGLQQLKKIDKFQKIREKYADQYFKELADLPLVLPAKPLDIDSQHAWHLFPIRLDNTVEITRDEFIMRMAERGVGCSVHFIPLHKQPVWRDTYHLKPEQ